MVTKIPIGYNEIDNNPMTMMILGAALAGGDPIKLAEQLAKQQEKNENDLEVE